MLCFDFHHHDSEKKFGIYNLAFNENVPDFYFSAGIHPNEIEVNLEEKFLWLKEIFKQKNCVAIGECGLDGLLETDEKLQHEVFAKQIEIANEIKKPIIIHCVKRFSELIPYRKKSKVPMIVHGFNKKETIGKELLRHDVYLSFGKSILQNVPLQEFLGNVPMEKIFLETDNSGLNIEEVYQKISELKNMKIDDLQQKIAENLQKIQISV